MPPYEQNWKKTLDAAALTPEHRESILEFCESVVECTRVNVDQIMMTYVKRVAEECSNLKQFAYFHKCEREPFDYYRFGLEMVRPLIDWPHSHILGIEQLKNIERLMEKGENVVLLANHQSEIEPQIISLLTEAITPLVAEEIIFVAGHRVVSDPLAVPLSRGRNLLCIYSKRYLEHSPEARTEKLQHNSRTLSALEELLSTGGKCIYVAPSGGRDRKGPSGEIELAPFDPSSTELFLLLGQRSKIKTHFIPLSVFTYNLLPPPEGIKVSLGEPRIANYGSAGLYFGDFIEPEKLSTHEDRKIARVERTDAIFQIVTSNYKKIVELCNCAIP